MSRNKRGARYLPFTCCTCVFLPLHGMQRTRRDTSLWSTAAPSLLSSCASLTFFRPRVVFLSVSPVAYPYSRRSVNPRTRTPSTYSLAKFPPLEFIPRRGKTNGRLSARPTAAKYVSRSPRIETPGLVNQRGIRAADIYFEQLVLIDAADSFDLSAYRWQKVTSEVDCTHVFWTSHRDRSIFIVGRIKYIESISTRIRISLDIF